MKRVVLFVGAMLLISTFAFADIDPDSLQACKFSRAGSPCEPGMGNDCPAFMVTVTVAPHVLDVTGSGLWFAPKCPGKANATLEGMLTLPSEGNWIIFLPIPDLPDGFPYSADWMADGNEVGCANFVVGNPDVPQNCDAAGADRAPAISIYDLK
jgi:hypothetical protein